MHTHARTCHLLNWELLCVLVKLPFLCFSAWLLIRGPGLGGGATWSGQVIHSAHLCSRGQRGHMFSPQRCCLTPDLVTVGNKHDLLTGHRWTGMGLNQYTGRGLNQWTGALRRCFQTSNPLRPTMPNKCDVTGVNECVQSGPPAVLLSFSSVKTFIIKLIKCTKIKDSGLITLKTAQQTSNSSSVQLEENTGTRFPWEQHPAVFIGDVLVRRCSGFWVKL